MGAAQNFRMDSLNININQNQSNKTMKKKLLLLGTGLCLSLCTHLNAQRDPDTGEFYGTCGTQAPTDESEQAFQKQIAAYKLEKARGVVATYEIPVIVHVLYKQGLSVGSTANIAAAQVKAQIDALNDCMAGIAPGNSKLPTPFANVDANDISIHFCLATKGTDGKTLAEPGIDRVNFTAKGWSDPATLDANSIQSYFDQTIKPGCIWDPKKYFNIWVGDFFDPAKGGLLGYATFPTGTGLSGLTSNLETPTTSGVVMATRVFGCKAKYANGYYASEAYIYGITTAHEVGHYLGLRHIGGDSPCSTDYCNDTPAQKGGYQSGPNGQNWGCPTYPFQANACGSGTSPNGEMFQNFMDYTTDACRSLFTQDQEDRMMTAMQNGTYRKAFGTHGLCSAGPTAVFSANKTTVCAGETVTFTDKSTSSPTSWKWTFTGGTPATSTQQNPAVTYSTAGTYDVKLVVSNTGGSDSVIQTKYITVNTAPAAPTVTGDKRCGPGVVNLSATGSGTLEWYDAATAGNKVNTGTTYGPNISTTTTYYVGVASTGSCPGQRTAVTGTINPLPAKPSITLAGNGVDLTTSSTGVSYQWFFNGNKIAGATSQNYTPKEKGNYTVTITDANGCTNTSDAFVVTGISRLENQASFEIFPNPGDGHFTFNLNIIEKGDYQIQLKNVLGQVIYNENLSSFKGTYTKQFDLTSYGKGVYIVTLLNAYGQEVKKLIVE